MESPMSSSAAVPFDGVTTHKRSLRWTQLAIGLVCMMAISSPQYVWALFTKPMAAKLGVTLAELQVTFSILIVLQTFLAPVQGFLVEKFGPKRTAMSRVARTPPPFGTRAMSLQVGCSGRRCSGCCS